MGKPKSYLLALLVVSLFAMASCSYSDNRKPDGSDGDGSDGDGGNGECEITFNLINPCGEDLLSDPSCYMLNVVISSTNPQSPLYPGNSPGPIVRRCQNGYTECPIDCDLVAGPGMIIDVICEDQSGDPFARAISLPMLLPPEDHPKPIDLLLGRVNGFIRTTHLKGDSVGTCSQMAQDGGRFGHTATLLDDGRVLIVGGVRRIGPVEEVLATVEIFDPSTGVHEQLIGPGGRPLAMNASSGRAFHTATKLRDGNVLITCGVGIVQNMRTSLRSSEIFDVNTETFPPGLIAITDKARAHHTATMLNTSGKVLVTGGAIYDAQTIVAYHDDAEVYDPATKTWTAAQNNMSSPRAFHTATELDPNADQGKVIVIGGSDATGSLKTVDIYDPGGNQFYTDPDPLMAVNRAHHCAVLLENGEVLVAGGTTTTDVADVHAGIDFYSSSLGGPFGGFRQQTLNLSNARMDHTCTLLVMLGDVLVAGGLTGSGQATGSGEVVLVNQGPIYSVAPLTNAIDPPRYLHTATRLGNGLVYIAGGLSNQAAGAQAITQSILYVPEAEY